LVRFIESFVIAAFVATVRGEPATILRMPKFTVIVHASAEDVPCLERTLQSADIASDILLINGEHDPEIKKIGRRFLARERTGVPGVTAGAYLMDAFHHWILVIRPGEELSEELRKNLDEWRHQKKDDSCGYRLLIVEQNGDKAHPLAPELRLVNRQQVNWIGELPPNMEAPTLPGALLRHEQYQEENRLAS
jgi:hypothetical protein